MATIGTGVARRPLSNSENHRTPKTSRPRSQNADRRDWSLTLCFVPQDVADPFDTVEWELRTAAIKGEGGRGALRAERLRNPHLLEPIGHQRRRQQVFLRRGRHARARDTASGS